MTDREELLRRIPVLLEDASRFQQQGRVEDAEKLIDEAKHLAAGYQQACAEIDLSRAISLLEASKHEEGVRHLSAILAEYADWFLNPESRDVYEIVQLQRAFSLIHLEMSEEALPLLEEATSFQLERATQSHLHCHLGRCYHERSRYSLAKEHFERADAIGVGDDWRSAFHYYFGYTLYKLRDFQRAKRQFILCVQSDSSGPPESMRYAMLAATSRKLGEHSEASCYDQKAKSPSRWLSKQAFQL
jgi:tetratricopeptide (TPR) repeat protein